MANDSDGHDNRIDEILNRLIRDADDRVAGSVQRPSWSTIRDFVHAVASDEQVAEIQNALSKSPSFRQEMREIMADLERLEDPAIQAELSRVDRAVAPEFPPLARSRFVVRLEQLGDLVRAGADETLVRIERFLSGLRAAGSAPLELIPVAAGLRGEPTTLEGIPDVWDHVRRGLTKGDEVRCSLGDIGTLTVRRNVPADSLELSVQTSVPGRLEIWCSVPEGMEKVALLEPSGESASIPADDLKPGVIMCWIDAD